MVLTPPTARMLPGKKHIGRPAVTGPAELAALRGLIADGKSVTEAARILKIGRSTAMPPSPPPDSPGTDGNGHVRSPGPSTADSRPGPAGMGTDGAARRAR